MLVILMLLMPILLLVAAVAVLLLLNRTREVLVSKTLANTALLPGLLASVNQLPSPSTAQTDPNWSIVRCQDLVSVLDNLEALLGDGSIAMPALRALREYVILYKCLIEQGASRQRLAQVHVVYFAFARAFVHQKQAFAGAD